MPKNMFDENISSEERLRRLKDNSDIRSEGPYIRQLTQAEVDTRHQQLADNCIEVNRLEDELGAEKKKFKGKIEPLKVARKQMLIEIKTRQAEFEGWTFGFANQDTGMMEFYDANGEWIGARRLTPEEKTNLFTTLKAAK